MSFAPVYLLNRVLFRLSDFFRHWYIDGSRAFLQSFWTFLARLDRVFALRITLHYFSKPLYGDYSVIGRVLGFVFRSLRVLIAIVLYAVYTLVFAALYIAWLILPLAALYFAYSDLTVTAI